MYSDEGRMNFRASLDISQLAQGATEAKGLLRSIGNEAQDVGSIIDASFDRLGNKMGKVVAGAFTLSAVKDFAKEIINVRGEVESLEISFSTLLGSDKKAKAMFSEIREFAVKTPMQLKDLAQSAQLMLSFNIDESKVVPYLKAIGDVSMGDSQKFQSLSLSFAQMSSAGKLMGQDLMQMINAGFNPLAVMAEKTGKSIKQLKDEMSAGSISAEMVQQAFIDATSEGGKFYGMLEKQSHGIKGAISNLQGAIDDMFNDLGEKMQGSLVDATNLGTYLVQNYSSVIAIIGTLVATYGTYRAALIVNNVMENTMAKAQAERIAAIEAEILAVGEKTAAEKLSADADIASAVAKGNLTEAQGLEILALKQAAAEKVVALQLAAKQAAADAASAVEASRAAMVRLKAAQANVNAMRMEYEAALAKGEVFEIAYAKERMEIAQTEVNTVSQQYQAAVTAEVTAAKQAQTAQTTANTAAQQLNNIQVQAGTMQQGLFATAVSVTTKAIKGLWATLMKHPVALVLAAVVALCVALYNWTKRSQEVNAQQRIMDDATAKASASIAEEKTKVETLSKILNDNTKSIKERKTALTELQKIAPDYHASLTEEGELINNNTEAINNYIAALMKAAKIEGLKGSLSKGYEELAEKALDIKNKMSDPGLIFGTFLSKDEIDKQKQEWSDWYTNFLANPMGKDAMGRDYIERNEDDTLKRNKDGSLSILLGSGEFAQYTSKNSAYNEEYLNEFLRAVEAYADTQAVYEQVLSEDIVSKSTKTKIWQEEVKKQREALKKAKEDLERLKKDSKSTVEQVSEAQSRIDAAEKALKGLGVDVKKEERAGVKAGNVNEDNADMLAKEAAERIKQAEAYANKLKDELVDAEFEIRQGQIDAMREGIEKVLAQNELDYKRLKEQNLRRQRDMLDDIAAERIRQMEDADPTIFKKKDSKGKLEEDPGKREEMYRQIRIGLTVDDLTPNQQRQIKEYADVADEIYRRANEDALEKMLADVRTYEQQRESIEKEYKRKRDALYEHDEDGNQTTLRSGVTEGNIKEINRQEQEALKALDEQIAQRSEDYQAWCSYVTELSLRELEDLLQKAKDALDEMENDGDYQPEDMAKARAKVNKLQSQIKTTKGQDTVSPGKRTLKEWEDLYGVLQDCEKEFESLGDSIGGTFGEIVSVAGQITTSTLSMVNGIVQLVEISKNGIMNAAGTAISAIKLMEAASVILTVLTAAFSIGSKIASLFNHDDDRQKEIDALQERIDQLQWELDHREILRYTDAEKSLRKVKDAISSVKAEYIKADLAAGNYWGAFITAMQKASNNQKVLQASAEKLAKSYANMGYTADKALGNAKYDDAKAQLENIAKQQIGISDQIDSERGKKKSDNAKITEYEQKIAELGQQALEIINEMVEDIIGGSSTDIANELADAFIEAFQAGEDAAQAWGDKVNEIVADVVKRMLVSKYLEEPLGDIFDKYKAKWFKDGQFVGLQAVIDSMSGFANDLNAVGQNFAAIWETLPSDVMDMFKATGDFSQSASEGGFAAMSQDTGDELNGRFTAIQINSEAIKDSVLAIRTSMEEMRNISLLSMGYLEAIERHTKELYEINESLDKIKQHIQNL